MTSGAMSMRSTPTRHSPGAGHLDGRGWAVVALEVVLAVSAFAGN